MKLVQECPLVSTMGLHCKRQEVWAKLSRECALHPHTGFQPQPCQIGPKCWISMKVQKENAKKKKGGRKDGRLLLRTRAWLRDLGHREERSRTPCQNTLSSDPLTD